MSDAQPFPRDDRSWPASAFLASLGMGTAALAGLVALLATASTPQRAAELAAAFLGLAVLEGASYVDAARPWLQGRPTPRRTWPIQIAIALVLLACFAGGGAMFGAGFCGYLAGVMFANAVAIRYARRNRSAVDAQVEHQDRERARGLEAERAWTVQELERRPAPQVGLVLRRTVAEDRARWLAWVAATTLASLGGALLGSGAAVFGIVFTGLCLMLWVGRRLLGVRLSLRDYERARTPPRRAFVVLVNDPNPRLTRTLLGVWSTEPVVGAGRMPRAEAVYRCDEERDALLSDQQHLVVHEAWLDSGPRQGSRPRWVAADAGIALPHRRALFGRWYLASVIAASRPARALPLRIPAPHPAAEAAASVVQDQVHPGIGWPRLFLWRLAGLLAVGAAFSLLA